MSWSRNKLLLFFVFPTNVEFALTSYVKDLISEYLLSFVRDSCTIYIFHFDACCSVFHCQFLRPTHLNHPPPPYTHFSLYPSENKLWFGPDIPSNLQSQHRVKRARVLQRKLLYAKAAVPKRDRAQRSTRIGTIKKYILTLNMCANAK